MQSKRRPSELPTGIYARHARSCATTTGGECDCQPSYRAVVYSKREKATVRKTFSGPGALAAAKGWRGDMTTDARRGNRVVPSKLTVREAAETWLAGAEADPPIILASTGVPYKPSVLRDYRRDLERIVLLDLGGVRVSELRRRDVQALVDRLVGEGRSGSKVRNAIKPLQVLYRHLLQRDEVQHNPTTNLQLPNGLGQRDRAASPDEATELLAALPDDLRPLYATAFYAGLRRGELRGLRWEDVNLADGVIHVRRSWDDYEGEVAPKSRKGTRRVPIIGLVRDSLVAQKLRTGGEGRHFVFPGRYNGDPFTPTNVRRKAAKAWASENARRVEEASERGVEPILLVPIGLHDCRHTFVSYCHDAGMSLERIGDYVGHSSTYMTDRYRHLLEGHEAEAARMLDAYLSRADTDSRLAQLDAEDE